MGGGGAAGPVCERKGHSVPAVARPGLGPGDEEGTDHLHGAPRGVGKTVHKQTLTVPRAERHVSQGRCGSEKALAQPQVRLRPWPGRGDGGANARTHLGCLSGSSAGKDGVASRHFQEVKQAEHGVWVWSVGREEGPGFWHGRRQLRENGRTREGGGKQT